MSQPRPYAAVNMSNLSRLIAAEEAAFVSANPESKKLFEASKASLHNGVPMNWMVRWASPYPLFVRDAGGQLFRDVDGHQYIDFCLGDTGAMAGHSPKATVAAITQQIARGMTCMLPNENAPLVGAELQRRFGLPVWQIAMTATDANRFVIRIARHLTGKNKIVVHNWCYHGTVDETFAILDPQTLEVVRRPGNTGAPVDPHLTTRVVEFNDLEGLQAALEHGDVAACLFEPAMTNIGIILPDPDYHAKVRELTRKYGVYLIIDETHTICAGPGGYTARYGLEPDFLTIGKPIAGGYPAAAYGFTRAVADRLTASIANDLADTGGIGGTLSGNAVAITAMHATLTHVLTPAAFERMEALAQRFEKGVQDAISEFGIPWNIVRCGCRVEYVFRADLPRCGGDAAAACGGDIDKFMHLFLLNRGILMTPFHAMALMCPDTTEESVDRHTKIFREAIVTLLGDAK